MFSAVFVCLQAAALCLAADDSATDKIPGVPFRVSGSDMMADLTGVERELYRKGREAFSRMSSVQGDTYIPETEVGLGPAFNGDSCVSCHAHPTPGGSSPPVNPQFGIALREGAHNRIPSFISKDGPALQVRFRHNASDAVDGTVHPLFTIAGRRDAPGCEMAQPDFEREQKSGNLSLRIPTPLYGIGLIEAISESEIEKNALEFVSEKCKFGISGHTNHNSSDGAISKLGWKAQTTSLESFAAEAYAVEQGVTNELFPQERMHPPEACLFNATPEDRFLPNVRNAVDAVSNITRVAYFLRFLAPPLSADRQPAEPEGRRVFQEVGCAFCHTPLLHTGKSSQAVLDERSIYLYSDLLVHRMGPQLADGISQGQAGPDEFRTAPLWGLGQRLFFLHDGRAKDLTEAILLHASLNSGGSEANKVISGFRQLRHKDREALLTFLRSL